MDTIQSTDEPIPKSLRNESGRNMQAFVKIAPMNDAPTPPLTISEFLEQTGAQAHFFDMGRRVVEIPGADMLAFERAEIPYPQPFLRSAWLGILFHYEKDEDTHQIWFLKFPLDEQGLLQQAARDDFLRRTFEKLGETLSASEDKQNNPDFPGDIPDGISDDNPHGFTPREDRMASFHAKIARQLGQAPSQYFQHAADYFTGETGFEQWNFVGLQGIADVAARLDENELATTLIAAIPQLPTTPFTALCSCLENENLDTALTRVIAVRVEKALAADNALTVVAGLRGLSYSQDQATVTQTLQSTLDKPAGRDVEVLAAIAGRAWEHLENTSIRRMFLENLAQCEAGQRAFDHILSDLLFMPGLRQKLLEDLRSPDCSEQLTSAIGAFFQSVQPT